MTLQPLGIVVGYLLLALGVGLLAYRVGDNDAEDFYLASRTLGTLVLLFTTFATLLSAFTFFGGPNLAYAAGPEWILVMGVMDGILFAVLWYVIGYRQWLIGRAREYVTLGEMLGDRFASPTLRALVAGVSLLWLFPYVMLQQMGAGEALRGLTSGAIPYWGGAALITVFMIAYVMLAGLRGVAWTDTLQGLFMLSVLWVAVVWVVNAAGGVGAATEGMVAANPDFAALGGGIYSPQFIISSAVTIAFGVTMFPQINQRFFVAESKAVIKRTLPLWPVLVLLLFVPAFMLGAWARGLGIQTDVNGNVLPPLLLEYTPAWFGALVIAGAMAAMMSSSDSMLLSGSSYFTRDLYRPLVEEATDRKEAFVGRVGVAIFATLSFVASLFRRQTLLEIGNTAFGGFAQLALPVMVALYWPGTTRRGIYAGVVGSQAFYLLSVFTEAVPSSYLGGWSASVVGMLLGLVLTVGVSLVTSAAVGEDASVYATGAD